MTLVCLEMRCSCGSNSDSISSNSNPSWFVEISVTTDSKSRGRPSRITSSCSWIDTVSPMNSKESVIFFILTKNSAMDLSPFFVFRSSDLKCRDWALILAWEWWCTFSQSCHVWRQPRTLARIGADNESWSQAKSNWSCSSVSTTYTWDFRFLPLYLHQWGGIRSEFEARCKSYVVCACGALASPVEAILENYHC